MLVLPYILFEWHLMLQAKKSNRISLAIFPAKQETICTVFQEESGVGQAIKYL